MITKRETVTSASITTIVLLCAAFTLTFAANDAFAKGEQAKPTINCDDLDEDPAWNTSLQKLAELVSQKQYAEAKTVIGTMNQKCNRSPIVNYLEGKILAAEGDTEKARAAFQKASEYTYEFAVTPDLSKNIWYSRYETEFPERTEASLQKLVDEQLAAKSELEKANAAIELNRQQLKSDYATGLWTGTGIGIAGIALVTTGLILNTTFEPYYDDKKNNGNHNSPKPCEDDASKSCYKITPNYIASWTLIGVGVAATAAGAIVSGIFGYKFAHFDDDTTLSMQLTPWNASLTMTF